MCRRGNLRVRKGRTSGRRKAGENGASLLVVLGSSPPLKRGDLAEEMLMTDYTRRDLRCRCSLLGESPLNREELPMRLAVLGVEDLGDLLGEFSVMPEGQELVGN